jgi:hypothetical protein
MNMRRAKEAHMVALLVALLFTAAFAVSAWSMWITIAPRLPYMRMLLAGDTPLSLAPAAAPRYRAVTRSTPISTTGIRPIRAAA